MIITEGTTRKTAQATALGASPAREPVSVHGSYVASAPLARANLLRPFMADFALLRRSNKPRSRGAVSSSPAHTADELAYSLAAWRCETFKVEIPRSTGIESRPVGDAKFSSRNFSRLALTAFAAISGVIPTVGFHQPYPRPNWRLSTLNGYRKKDLSMTALRDEDQRS